MNKKIKIETIVSAPIDKVWKYWTEPEHITKWAFASDDWEAPYSENDLRVGGKFVTKMAAKDGSVSFDFGGVYTKVIPNERIEYTMGDGRTVSVWFEEVGENKIKVYNEFEMETQNSEEMQRAGWQAILENFKKHVENE
jgi:uncharacterized protein YndB with AHSA1/START domain